MGYLYNKYSNSNGITKYKYIAFHIISIRGSSSFVQLSKLEFSDNDGNVFQFPSGTNVICTLSGGSSSEGPNKLIDGSVDTKMCRTGYSSLTGCYVLIILPPTYYLDILKYNNFSWYTANDATERDPISWELSVGNTPGGDDAFVVNSSISTPPTTNRKALAYTGSMLIPGTYPVTHNYYKYFKFHVSAIRNGKTSGMMQMCELQFTSGFGPYGPYRYPTNNMGISFNVTVYNSKYNLIDNNTKSMVQTNWTNSTDIILTFPDNNLLDIAKYRRMSVYTGGDVPDRDPKSWQLYASNVSDFSNSITLVTASNITMTTTRAALGYHTLMNV